MRVGQDANDVFFRRGFQPYNGQGPTGNIEIGRDLLGILTINGDLAGVSDDPIISIGRNLEGQIRILGSLENSGDDYYEIDIANGMDEDNAAIVIDYDGWDSDDSWDSGAEIQVGQTDYDGNNADDHVYEVSSCKADMDGDWSVDFDDIDPFVAALSGQAPNGLLGSMIFHGDMDCDDPADVDFDDVDPFVVRLTENPPCCYEECGDCPDRDGGGGGRLSPLELAHELAIHIAPQRYGALCDMIAEVSGTP